MKKFLLFVLVFVSFEKASAQNEYFQNSPSWICEHSAEPWPCVILDTNNYTIGGDTIVNSATYKILKSRGRWIHSTYFQQAPCVYSEYSWQDSTTGCIRSSGLQMYWMPYGDSVEYLLWDFNLAIGSHSPITYVNSDTSHTVTYIDSIYTSAGYRKIYYLNGNNFEYLIEGIGSSAGLFYHPGVLFEQGASLLCYSQNDTAWFPTQGPGCTLITTTTSPTQNQISLQLIPNPGTDFVNVELHGATIDRLEIYDARGQIVKSQVVTGIDTTDMTSGIYFVVVHSAESIYTAELIVGE